jgi:hypothetical protein
VFGARARKRVKSSRSWIGSVDDNRAGLSDGKDECTLAIRNRAADGYPERLRMAALEFRLAETLGCTAKPGWSPRKGRPLSSFLGASRVVIRRISRFFFQLRIRSFNASLVLQVCALASQGRNSTARKVGQIIARGDRRWLIRLSRSRSRNPQRKYRNRTLQGPMRDRQAYLTRQLRECDLGRDLEGEAVRG